MARAFLTLLEIASLLATSAQFKKCLENDHLDQGWGWDALNFARSPQLHEWMAAPRCSRPTWAQQLSVKIAFLWVIGHLDAGLLKSSTQIYRMQASFPSRPYVSHFCRQREGGRMNMCVCVWGGWGGSHGCSRTQRRSSGRLNHWTAQRSSLPSVFSFFHTFPSVCDQFRYIRLCPLLMVCEGARFILYRWRCAGPRCNLLCMVSDMKPCRGLQFPESVPCGSLRSVFSLNSNIWFVKWTRVYWKSISSLSHSLVG